MALSAAQQKLTRTDWKKEKELEEARKAGTAPALQDEEGKDINPHIPQYISDAPWYFGASGPTLRHQRPQEEKQKQYASIEAAYKRGKKETTAIKYRKGACENCGAMTHKKKDCLERPRRVGAKFTGEDIKPDEYIPEQLDFDYDGKRDRWVGYNPEEHQRVLEEYSKMEMAKQKLKSDKLHEDLMIGKKTEDKEKLSDEDDEDEDKYADDVIIPGQKFDSKRRTTVRNLRIREDTAKYLYNLDPNSSYYDPKTRSMRASPFGQKDIAGKAVTYQGDNFVRYSGDTQKMAKTQLFAWEAYEKGTDVHLQADPTKLELLHQEYKVKKEDYKQDLKGGILEKYGGEEHLDAPPKELLFAQTENYVEYSRTGEVVKGQEKAIQKSKYEEDVYINNHTSVWGSFWNEGRWGYSCCHSFIKGSYCTGEAGKIANVERLPTIDANHDKKDEERSLLEIHKDKQRMEKKEKWKKSDKEPELDTEKLKKALLKEEQQQKEADTILSMDERKRQYNSLKRDYQEVTPEELEAYRIKRRNADDPMNNFV